MDAEERLAAVEALLRAMGSPDPLGAVVRQLNAYVDGGAIIFDHSANPVRAAGRAPVHLLAASLDNGIAEGQLQLGRWRALVRAVTIRGSRYCAVLVGSDEGFMQDDGLWLLERLEAVLASLDGVTAFAAYERVRWSEQILRQLESGVLTARVPYYWDSLERLGFTVYSPVVYVRGTVNVEPASLVEETEKLAADGGIALIHQSISGDERSTFRMLISADLNIVDALREIEGVESAGVSEVFDDLGTVPDHAAAAIRAERMAINRGRKVQTGVELRPLEWLLAQRPSRLDYSQFDRFVAVIADKQDLVSTVCAYIQHDQSVDKCAEALSIHPNTVRYRLSQIEQAHGESMKNVDFLASLSIAHLWREGAAL